MGAIVQAPAMKSEILHSLGSLAVALFHFIGLLRPNDFVAHLPACQQLDQRGVAHTVYRIFVDSRPATHFPALYFYLLIEYKLFNKNNDKQFNVYFCIRGRHRGPAIILQPACKQLVQSYNSVAHGFEHTLHTQEANALSSELLYHTPK